jgi:hypothetical protein
MRRDRASSAGIPRKKFIDFFSLDLPTVQSSHFLTILKGDKMQDVNSTALGLEQGKRGKSRKVTGKYSLSWFSCFSRCCLCSPRNGVARCLLPASLDIT